MDLKPKILQFLYDQVQKGMIPQIRKNQAEELEAFIMSILAEIESSRSAERMQKMANSSEETDETDTE